MSHPALVLLAAGNSRRMGTPKGLLNLHGKLFVQTQCEAFHAVFPGTQVVIVLGDAHRDYAAAWPELSNAGSVITSVINPAPERGPFSSLRLGLAAVAPQAKAIFVQPVDVPPPLDAVWARLLKALDPAASAVTPEFGGRGGHPVVLSRRFADQLIAIPEDEPAARLDVQLRELSPEARRVVVVDDQNVAMNLNDPETWSGYVTRQSFAAIRLPL